MTSLDTIPQWTSVPPSLPVAPFLAAADGVVALVDALGSAALAAVRSDIAHNVRVLRDAHALAPAAPSVTALVDAMSARGLGQPALSLRWLGYTLVFLADAFRRLAADPALELAAAFQAAYPATLQPRHSLLQRTAFRVAIGYVPPRAIAMRRIGDPTPARVGAYAAPLAAVAALIPQ